MSATLLGEAVHGERAEGSPRAQDRLFALWFQRLVYNQIWEDPRVDLEALAVGPESRIVTIASAGCNVLNYLLAGPRQVVAVDLNPAHLALTRLKLAAAAHLPDHAAFFRMFGSAAGPANETDYRRYLAPQLDADTRAFWEGRPPVGRPRLAMLSRGLYRHGASGRFIGLLHRLLRLRGLEPAALLTADAAARERLFQQAIAPAFRNPVLRWLCNRPASLYSLGIPPAQFRALRAEAEGDIARLLSRRVHRLACGFPVEENYFAWQAFGRRYGGEALPDYLRAENFPALRASAARADTRLASLTDFLGGEPARSVDRFVLLDAQDWMDGRRIRRLWQQIDRTARPGARVVFRTAAAPSPLEGALSAHLLGRWRPERDVAERLHARDRSAIYGGFHLYVLAG